MNVWISIKKFFTRVSKDEVVKVAADKALDAAKDVAVDYVKDIAQKEINRHKG